MSAIRARVINGRLHLDAPTSLPEGTVLDLVVDDEGDNLSDAERAALTVRVPLTQVISRSWGSICTGQGRSAADVIDAVRKR